MDRRHDDGIESFSLQQQLRDSEAAFRASFEQSAVGMAHVATDGSWLRVNERLCAMLGYTHEELLELTFADLTHPDDVERDVGKLREMLAGGASEYSVEKRYVCKDGSIIWVRLNVTLVRDDKGVPQYAVDVIEDVTESRHAISALQASELKFETVFRTSPEAILITRLSDGMCLDASDSETSMFGYARDEVLGRTGAELGIWVDPEERQRLAEAAAGPSGVDGFEARMRRKDGTAMTVLMSAREIDIEGEHCILSMCSDISDRKASEQRILGLNRIYRVLSGINEALVYLRQTSALFDEACRVIVEEGGFLAAWVGLVDPSDNRVRVVAQAGETAGYLDNIEIVVGHETLGRGPTGVCIAEGRHVYSQDIEDDPAMAPWREKAIAHGYRSSASFPLKVEGKTVGAYTMYSAEPGTFDDEQVALLDELAADISFAMEVARIESERSAAESELARSEAKFSTMFRVSPDAMAVSGLSDGVLLDVNEGFTKVLGYRAEDTLGRTTLGLGLWIDPTDRLPFIGTLSTQGFISDYEAPFRRADGSVMTGLISARVLHVEDTPIVLSVIRDITESRATAAELERRGAQLEELVREREKHLSLLSKSLESVIGVVGQVVESRDPYTAGHQRRVSELATRIAREMGMTEEEVEEIRVAALIHDVGKVSVPAEILSKPGALSPLEFSLIKSHSKAGYRIIASANMEGPTAEMVYQHHERCDGTGYPRGLTGDQLLPGAKVIMVADVAEAMMSHRPYRATLGADAALAEIERGAGSIYDAKAAAVCLRVFREQGFAFTEH